MPQGCGRNFLGKPKKEDSPVEKNGLLTNYSQNPEKEKAEREGRESPQRPFFRI